MSVPIEYFSVIVPVRTIEERFNGGLARFREVLGEGQTDGELVRLGGMSPMVIAWIVKDLERGGLKGIKSHDGKDVWLDYCIVDRCQGPTLPCSWIQVDLKTGMVKKRARQTIKGNERGKRT
jgi:hypothetical protein